MDPFAQLPHYRPVEAFFFRNQNETIPILVQSLLFGAVGHYSNHYMDSLISLQAIYALVPVYVIPFPPSKYPVPTWGGVLAMLTSVAVSYYVFVHLADRHLCLCTLFCPVCLLLKHISGKKRRTEAVNGPFESVSALAVLIDDDDQGLLMNWGKFLEGDLRIYTRTRMNIAFALSRFLSNVSFKRWGNWHTEVLDDAITIRVGFCKLTLNWSKIDW